MPVQYDAAQSRANCFDPDTRTPWNNVLFPGNYVCHLNSYRNQGVNSYPGLEFFSLVGALVILPIENTASNLLDASGQLPAGTYNPQILSPDLGPSPKPLVNKPFKLPAGAYVYSVAANVVNLEGVATTADADIIDIVGGNLADVGGTNDLTLNLGTDADGTFNVCGARNLELDFSALVANATASNIQITTSAAIKPVNVSSGGSGSAYSDPTSGQSAIIVEVDYFMPAQGPDSDQINLPFPYSAESVDY